MTDEPRTPADEEDQPAIEVPAEMARAAEDTGASSMDGISIAGDQNPSTDVEGVDEDAAVLAAETEDDPEGAEDGVDDASEVVAVAEAAEATPRRRRRGARKSAQADVPSEAAPAPTRRRRPAGEAAPVVQAKAKYVRTSARKARLVCDHIRGKSVEEARAILALAPRQVAEDWSKLLESAVANAEHNHELIGDELKIVAVYADEGPTLKRFRPRAMGRATRIRKRTSHLTIKLTEKD